MLQDYVKSVSQATKSSRPTLARIDLEALKHNFALAKALSGPDRGILAVVKANAYGHGALPVAKCLVSQGVCAFGVATPEEGMELRNGGIELPILLFGGPFGASAEELEHFRLTPILYELGQIKALHQSIKRGRLDFHLKIDTGMTRLGIFPHEISNCLEILKHCPRLRLCGILTHLASADEGFEVSTQAQYQLFAEASAKLKHADPNISFLHLANSAAILGEKLEGYNWVRPGIMLYGANPSPLFKQGEKLKPVMHLETQVVSLKEVPVGTAVSYGGEWIASRPSRIAALPIGYADGYPRLLGNRAQVLVEGCKAPVAGRVCMDLTMVDVTDLPKAQIGSQVRLWGEGLPVEQVATWAQTISYELLCGVALRVPRVYEGG